MSIARSAAMVAIVDPFLPTVRLLTHQSAPSAILTESPTPGVAGNESAHVPPEVSAIILSPLIAVYVVVFTFHCDRSPLYPEKPLMPDVPLNPEKPLMPDVPLKPE